MKQSDSSLSPRPVSQPEFARAAGLSLLARLGAIIEVVSQPYFIWLFSLSSYGLFSAELAFIMALISVLDFGVVTTLVRFIPNADDDTKAHSYLKAGIIITFIASCFGAVIMAALSSRIQGWFNASEAESAAIALHLIVFSLALPITILIDVFGAAVRARRAFGPEIRLRTFYEHLFRIFATTIVWLLGYRELGLVLGYVIGLAMTLLMAVFMLRRYYSLRKLISAPIKWSLFSQLLSYGIPLVPAELMRRAFIDLPTLVLNFIIPGAQGAIAAAYFTISRKVSSIIQMVRLAFMHVMGPLASIQLASVNMKSVAPLYNFSIRLVEVIIIPLSVTIMACGDEFLALFSREAVSAYNVLAILVAGRAVEAMSGPATVIIMTLGRRFWPLVSMSYGIFVWAVLAMILTDSYGAVGMAISLSVGLNVSAWAARYQLTSMMSVTLFDRQSLRSLFVSSFFSALLWILHLWIVQAYPVANVPVNVIAMLLVFWLSARFGLSLEDRILLHNTAPKLRLVTR